MKGPCTHPEGLIWPWVIMGGAIHKPIPGRVRVVWYGMGAVPVNYLNWYGMVTELNELGLEMLN